MIKALPENIHSHPVEGHWKFQGERSLKAKFLKESWELKMTTFIREGMEIFRNNTTADLMCRQHYCDK